MYIYMYIYKYMYIYIYIYIYIYKKIAVAMIWNKKHLNPSGNDMRCMRGELRKVSRKNTELHLRLQVNAKEPSRGLDGVTDSSDVTA